MKKKIFLAMVSAMSVLALAACSNTNTEIASMKGAKINVSDFYEKAKTDQNSKQIVFDMILAEVFTSKYGDKVTDKAVEKEIKTMFGDNFEEQLKTANVSRKEVEQSIRESLAFKEGLKAHVKLTDDDLKAAWTSFHPEVETQMIAVMTEDEAKEVKKEVSKKGADFGKIAKEKSLAPSKDDQGKVKFDSSTAATEVPDEVKLAAWDLKDGEISEPIAANSTYGTTFYIVKMVKNQDKGNDMSKFEKQIKEIATNAKLNDTEFTTKAIGQELTDANVKIKDEAFSDILTGFVDAAKPKTESSTSATEAADTKASETKESAAKSSETKETKASEKKDTKKSETKESTTKSSEAKETKASEKKDTKESEKEEKTTDSTK